MATTLNPSEISDLIKSRIEKVKISAEARNEGTIVSVADGIVRIHGLADVVASLEKRFARKLSARVELEPELIGGIRVVVGDEVLDTSVRARLERMKVALSA